MEERYNTIIVGAGIAGLICGAYLAKHGQRTVILEKKSEIGGRIKLYEFDGYSATIQGPPLLQAWDGGFWATAAREVGANVKFVLSKEPMIYVRGSHQPPKRLPRCYTETSLADYVESRFPEPLPPAVKDEFKRIFREILAIPYRQLCVDLDTVSLRDWLSPRTSNPMIHLFFGALGANMAMEDAGKALDSLSAGRIFAIIRMWLAGEGTLGFPVPDSLRGLAQPFADVVKAHGGEVRTGCEVDEVVVEGGRAVGVIAAEGGGQKKRFSSDRVIVNALYRDIPKLFKKLPVELNEPVRRLTDTLLVDYWTFTGLRERVTNEAGYIMVQDPVTGSNLGGMMPLCLDMPWCAPPGKQLIAMCTVYTKEMQAKVTPKEIYAEMNAMQEEVYPGFRERIEVQKVASHQPLWHHQFSSAPKIPQKSSSVKSLYFVGDSTSPQYSFGMDGPSSTGMLCAKAILGI